MQEGKTSSKLYGLTLIESEHLKNEYGSLSVADLYTESNS